MREKLKLRGALCFPTRVSLGPGPSHGARGQANPPATVPPHPNTDTLLKGSEIRGPCVVSVSLTRHPELLQSVNCPLAEPVSSSGHLKLASLTPAYLCRYFCHVITGNSANPEISQLTDSSSVLSPSAKIQKLNKTV